MWLTCIDVKSCEANDGKCIEGGTDSQYRCGVCGECEPLSDVEEAMLASVESDPVKIVLGVDSGAEVTCIRPEVATDYPSPGKSVEETLFASGDSTAMFKSPYHASHSRVLDAETTQLGLPIHVGHRVVDYRKQVSPTSELLVLDTSDPFDWARVFECLGYEQLGDAEIKVALAAEIQCRAQAGVGAGFTRSARRAINDDPEHMLKNAYRGLQFGTRHSTHRRRNNLSRRENYRWIRMRLKGTKGAERFVRKRWLFMQGGMADEDYEYSESDSGDELVHDIYRFIPVGQVSFSQRLDDRTALSLVRSSRLGKENRFQILVAVINEPGPQDVVGQPSEDGRMALESLPHYNHWSCIPKWELADRFARNGWDRVVKGGASPLMKGVLWPCDAFPRRQLTAVVAIRSCGGTTIRGLGDIDFVTVPRDRIRLTPPECHSSWYIGDIWMKEAALLRRPKPDYLKGTAEVLSKVNRYIDDAFNGFGDTEGVTDSQMLDMAKDCFCDTVMVSNPIKLDCEAAVAARQVDKDGWGSQRIWYSLPKFQSQYGTEVSTAMYSRILANTSHMSACEGVSFGYHSTTDDGVEGIMRDGLIATRGGAVMCKLAALDRP